MIHSSIKASAVLLMAGSGRRFGAATPKQFLMLAGKKVYEHTLNTFLRSRLFTEIILVCHPEWLNEVKNELPDTAGIHVIAGGTTRQESSYLGLSSLAPCDVAVIHDAVRPLVSEEILRRNVQGAMKYGAVDTCIASADTLVHSFDGAVIADIPTRSEWFRGQTPQSFRLEWILEAHRKARLQHLSATDDCKLVAAIKKPIQIIEGDETNIKITTELDLFVAEQLFRLQKHHTLTASTSLAGKIFAVVGGGGGIGSAIIQELQQHGATALSLSRSSTFTMDLTDPHSISSAFSRLHEKWGPLDGLINCAGILCVKPLSDMSLQEIERSLQTNLQGLIWCCKTAVLKNGAHLINISSSSFSKGRKNYSVYSAAKAGVVNFTQALAEERPDLRVWTVIPQRANTSMRRTHFPHEDPHTLLPPPLIAQRIVDILKDPHNTGMQLEIRKDC